MGVLVLFHIFLLPSLFHVFFLSYKSGTFAEDDLPDDQTDFLELNAELSLQWPVISQKKDPPPDAADWEDVPDKKQHLER